MFWIKEIPLRSRDTLSCEVGSIDVWGGSSNVQDATKLFGLSMPKVSVGVIVHNEEKNILDLLRSVSEQKSSGLVIDEVIVVSSGSGDKTNEFVLKYMQKDNKVRLIVQDSAEGKSSGINEFLKASKNEIIVISSGDVIFNEMTLQNLVSPLVQDQRVGLCSARPVPVNDSDSFMGTVVQIHWRLHHVLERHGETIAFRKSLVNHIPDEVSADEAYIEAIVRAKAFKTVLVSDSLVFNKGSENIAEFLSQIRRHYAGHLFIKAKASYLVSSMTIEGSAKIVKELLKCLFENASKLHHIMGYVLLEGSGRLLGIWDFYVRRKHYRIWSAARTTKILNKNGIEWSRK